MGAKYNNTLKFMGEHPILTFFGAVIVVGGIAESIGYIAGSVRDPEIKREQVIGTTIEDTFVEVDGTRFYQKIDGVLLEDTYRK